MGKFTNQQKYVEAKREIGLRKYVYEKRVKEGRMLQMKAAELIGIMEEIAEDYRLLTLRDEKENSLFANQ